MCQPSRSHAHATSPTASLNHSRNVSLLSLVGQSDCSKCSSVCGAIISSGTTPCGQSALPAIMGVVGGSKASSGSYVGILDVLKLGVGPSSSHTMGPMLAAKQFVEMLEQRCLASGVARITVDLYGSLALTGKGHATDRASVLGLAGFRPDSIDPDASDVVYNDICTTNTLGINGRDRRISFSPQEDVIFHETVELPYHPNGMTITAFGATIDDNCNLSVVDMGSSEGEIALSVLLTETYYSIGGGFINTEADLIAALGETGDNGASAELAPQVATTPNVLYGLTILHEPPHSTQVSDSELRMEEDSPSAGLLSDSTSVGSMETGTPSPRYKQNMLEACDIGILVDDNRSTAASSGFPPTLTREAETPPPLEKFGSPSSESKASRNSTDPVDWTINEPAPANCQSPNTLKAVPFPFNSAEELLGYASQYEISFAEIMMRNECAWRGITRTELNEKVDALAAAIDACVDRGLRVEGRMPVSNIPRRAARMHRVLLRLRELKTDDPMGASDWIALFARAVNEENACGGRVVTAPTNGAAGTLPAVLTYYRRFVKNSSQEGVRVFLATAAAIGSLCKRNASISGAEAGCQAEVGSACAMAAAGLCAVLGGSPSQIENAAEIGLEHCLGMTCDPISGLVQIPCIERNCVASVKAVLASRMALMGDGEHEVSLDSCVETMYRTGLDMQAKYRETSTGGLAVFARKLAAPVSPKVADGAPRLRSFDQAFDF